MNLFSRNSSAILGVFKVIEDQFKEAPSFWEQEI